MSSVDSMPFLRGPCGQPSCTDDHGHGTHIAGIIAAAANGEGIIGVAPEATIVAVKVLDHNAIGFLSEVINGVNGSMTSIMITTLTTTSRW